MATIDALRDLIYARDNGLCGICGQPVERIVMTLDHIEPRAFGGSDKFINLRTAHRGCNSRRGSRCDVAPAYGGLLRIRKWMGLSREKLAVTAKVSNKTIVSIEGGAWPRQSTIRKLATALGIAPRDLARELRREQEREGR